MYINEEMNHRYEFDREIKEFPRSQYDDLIDAWGNAIAKLRKSRIRLWGLSGQ
jgi:hypothetical protein